jgi:hypothetical protein
MFILIFMPIWLAGWTFGGSIATWQIFSGQSKESWFLVLWLFGWLAGELFVLYAFLWAAFGYELITSEHGMIIIKRCIFGSGPSRKFEISKISNFRASGFFAKMMSWSYNMAYWGLSGGTVAFDYENKPIRFGINLNEDVARQLAAIMKSRFTL